MDIFKDKRVVLTLDAGGTNFVFGAIKGGKEIVNPLTLPSNANNLDRCLASIIDGFDTIKIKLSETPVAISFAFPGPADYNKGIIGDLANLPSFRGGIALAQMLQEKFDIPVFIQNDGDLYAYGEAIGGVLPDINAKLKLSGSQKEYKNLIGLTLGTGFGAGIVHNGILISGDNSIPTEIWNIANSISPWQNAEDGVSTRAIVNSYFEKAGLPKEDLMPRDIYLIAMGEKDGNAEAAKESFYQFGLHLGDAIATMIMLFDGIVVIGGGLTGAKELYMPAAMEVLKGTFKNNQKRLLHNVFSLDDETGEHLFYKTNERTIKVPFSETTVVYDPVPKTAVATTKIGASNAIALGAYAYALSQLNN
ncbi:ROK family protein [uncultured Draconibacterium sp.]|uniref:ROK family protein n=1 Tax=uncultured Draconibacterium sp. TaxID=1573823 RepID=UPI0029C66E0D|nr:ROK family protein [uncultured Draconibacterium sp.]